MRDTIYAPATPAGISAIAVIRISGPSAGDALDALGAAAARRNPRRATRARLRDPRDGLPLDDALALFFAGPASETGEDVAELHVHGGRAVLSGVIDALARIPGLRLARPGEFARRAFDSGKLELEGVEALADLVAAETAAQARQALAQLGGALGRACAGWRERLLAALARAEAELDFPDEDLPGGMIATLRPVLAAIEREIATALDDARAGERLRDGYHVAIVGPPNAGKSSLLNALAGRDAAIVSHVAGTTRDVIEVHLALAGLPLIVADTAGLRPPGEGEQRSIEAEGMRRARERAAQADLRLIVIESGAAEEQLAAPELRDLHDADAIVLVNKVDLTRAPALPVPALAISALTGEGLSELLATLARRARESLTGRDGTAPIVTRARHREALEECRDALTRAVLAGAPELFAEDLRLALRALGRISGRVDVEEMLDRLFAEFCIGK